MALAQRVEAFTPLSAASKKRGRILRKSISATNIAGYLGVFLLIVSLVAVGYRPPQRQTALADSNNQLASTQYASDIQPASPVDTLLATNVAANIADTTNMPIANNVANLSQSLTAESSLAQTNTNAISKPQVIDASIDSVTTKKYTAVAGDTIPVIAARYNVSAQTVRWANSLTSDAVEPGRTLAIPPQDGVLYTVRVGDTIDSVAAKYKSDRQLIVDYNNLNLTQTLTAVGSQVLIPGGDLPAAERPGYVAPRTYTSYTTTTYGSGSASYSNLSASVGNRYAYGNCTWYAYERRAQLGMPVGSFWGNASTWAYNASLAGYRVDGNPGAGAVMENGGGYGHVSVVESVNVGVSVHVSEMNGYRWGGGFNRIASGDIPWSEAVSGMYRYIH